MNKWRTSFFLVFALGSFFLQPLLGSTEPPKSQDEGVLELVRESLDAAFQALETEHSLSYQRSSLSIHHNRKGEISHQEEQLWQTVSSPAAQEMPFVEVLIQQDGVPLPPEKIWKQLKKMQNAEKSPTAEGDENDDDFEITSDSFFPRFFYRFIEQTETGEKVIAFTPKKNLPAKNQSERLLNHLTGKFWIDPSKRWLQRAEVVLIKPITRYLGTVQLKTFSLALSFIHLDQDVFAIERLDLTVRGRVLYLFRFWEDVQETYTYYPHGNAPIIPGLETITSD